MESATFCKFLKYRYPQWKETQLGDEERTCSSVLWWFLSSELGLGEKCCFEGLFCFAFLCNEALFQKEKKELRCLET